MDTTSGWLTRLVGYWQLGSRLSALFKTNLRKDNTIAQVRSDRLSPKMEELATENHQSVHRKSCELKRNEAVFIFPEVFMCDTTR